jgi:hypothetical protein
MANKNIYYINIKPYIYDLTFEKMYERFINSDIGISILKNSEITNENFIDFMNKNIKLYNFQVIEKLTEEYEIDNILGKKILFHLELFFKKNNNTKTRKRNIHKRNKTSKR